MQFLNICPQFNPLRDYGSNPKIEINIYKLAEKVSDAKL